jgi:hypothetical protein
MNNTVSSKKLYLVIGCILLSLIAALIWYINTTANKSNIDSTEVGPSLTAKEGSEPSSEASSTMKGKQSASNSKVAHPFPEIPKTRANIALEDDIFGPQSKEEQLWLDRHGFPNAEQLDAYAVASDDVLKQAAAAGDKVAQTTLDMRKVMLGDQAAEENILKSAALDGNISGILRLAGFLGGASRPLEQSKRAYALTRVAEMFGDNKVGLTRDFMITKPLEQADRMEAEAEALRIFSDLTETRRARYGMNVAMVDPRPLPPAMKK